MRLIRHPSACPLEARGAVLAVGNFDGLHIGHQALIGAARVMAEVMGRPCGVLTFEPHPREVLRPEDGPFRLTPMRAKVRGLQALGMGWAFVLRTDAGLLAMSAEAFVEDVLVGGFGAHHLVIGSDFRFGHKRQGDVALLSRIGAPHGLTVTHAGRLNLRAGVPYSSTAVREALVQGRPEEAAAVLGRPWEIIGRVIGGDRLGRSIGYPTANLALDRFLRPALGVYAVRAAIDGPGQTVWWDGVANIGNRPTVDGREERLEVHLLNAVPDLYGRCLRVKLLRFLRSERRFESLEILREQIAADVAAARLVFSVRGDEADWS